MAWAAFLALGSGFVYWTKIVLGIQAHKAMMDAHPFDWYADGCLGLGLTLLAALYLSRPAPPPARRKARGAQNGRPFDRKSAKRMRRHRVQ